MLGAGEAPADTGVLHHKIGYETKVSLFFFCTTLFWQIDHSSAPRFIL